MALVALPLLVAAAAAWYVASGRVERRIEAGYSARLPGVLRIGGFSWEGTGTAVLRDISLGEEGQPPLLTAAEARATIAMGAMRLERLDISGAHMRLDRRSWELLLHIIEAESRIPPRGPPVPTPITVRGGLDVDGGFSVTDAVVDIIDAGPVVTADARAAYAGRTLKIGIDVRPEDGRRRLRLEGLEARGPLLPALASAAAIGLCPPLPPVVAALLPAEIDATGTVVTQDIEAEAWRGDVRATWEGGTASAQFSADPHAIAVTRLRVDDPRRLQAEGRIAVDLDEEAVTVELGRWRPGPELPLPGAVPFDALLAIVPALKLEARLRTGEERLTATLAAHGTARSSVRVEWRADGPVLVTGNELPLSLGQSFLPPEIAINGGLASRMSMRVGPDGLQECYVEARQARCSARGWSAGPLDGDCTIAPVAGGGVAISAELQRGAGEDAPAPRLGRVNVSHAKGVTAVKVELDRVEDVLIRLRGPSGLPDLRGGLSLDLRLDHLGEGALRGRVQRLVIEALALPDLLHELGATIRGDFTWRDRFEARLGGQLHRGSVRLPGAWLDVAQRTPIFTAAFDYSPAIGYAPAALDVNEILVRAADERGEPLASGYSAQLRGNLTATGTGQIRGVVDHADLGWVNSMLSLGAINMSGEGAVAMSADLFRAQMVRLDGAFLPLNADLRIGRNFHATGITGAVQFTMSKNPEDTKP